jgi:signal transduction histidine kinase
VILTIDDNGVGIDSTPSSGSGMGLRSMRYRAGILDGAIEISALPGSGTRICCRAPLPAATTDSIHAG